MFFQINILKKKSFSEVLRSYSISKITFEPWKFPILIGSFENLTDSCGKNKYVGSINAQT